MKAALIVKAIKAYMKKEEFKYDYDREYRLFKLFFSMPGDKFESLRTLVVVHADCGILSFSSYPMKADSEHRDEVLKYINKQNWKTRIGNFEMDPADGEVRFRIYADLEGLDESSSLEGILENTVQIPGVMLIRHSENLFKLMTGAADADDLEKTGDDDEADQLEDVLDDLREGLARGKSRLEKILAQSGLDDDDDDDDDDDETGGKAEEDDSDADLDRLLAELREEVHSRKKKRKKENAGDEASPADASETENRDDEEA